MSKNQSQSMTSMQKNVIWGLVAFTAVLLVVILVIVNKDDGEGSTTTNVSRDLIDENASFLGSSDAPVTIVGFSDFQCPYCELARSTAEDVVRSYNGQVRMQYRHFPLLEIGHDYAEVAAQATEAAALQGKFWSMHDLIFDNQSRLSTGLFTELAEELGLDMDQFDADFRSDAVKNKVKVDREVGESLGVTGTPTFFVLASNGDATSARRVNGNQPQSVFEEAIDAVLSELQ
jgi:protein-disulfide isomerase